MARLWCAPKGVWVLRESTVYRIDAVMCPTGTIQLCPSVFALYHGVIVVSVLSLLSELRLGRESICLVQHSTGFKRVTIF